jgi:LysM repeat protein
MFDHTLSVKWRTIFLLLVVVLVGLLAACRVRPAPGSVTPVANPTSSGELATQEPYPPPAGTEIVPQSPTSVPTDEEDEATSTPLSTSPTAPEATQIPSPTPVPAQPTPVPSPETDTPTPISTAGDYASSLVPGSTFQHRVERGEWLIQIARCYGVDYGAVLSANRVRMPDRIIPGEILTIPAIGSTGPIIGPPCVIAYTVQPGDTWDSLAQQFGTTSRILRLANPGVLIAGNQIWVPRAG